MSKNLVDEITTKAMKLPSEQQREVLQMVESLLQRAASGSNGRPRRSLKGDLAHLGSSVTDKDIQEARREMWRGYMGEDFNE
jgi:hypothetical protein